jgi:hypothetical protein
LINNRGTGHKVFLSCGGILVRHSSRVAPLCHQRITGYYCS